MDPLPLPGRLYFEHPGFDSMLLRTLHHVRDGALDPGDILQTCLEVEDGNWASWVEAWNRTALRQHETAWAMDARKYRRSSAMAFLRASEAYRNAFFPFLAVPGILNAEVLLDPMQECFCEAMARLPVTIRQVRIPFEETELHGCFIAPGGADKPRPTVIVNSGYTVFFEEEYFLGGADALRRGWNCFLYDGPGQGHTWLRNGLRFRPDWENVLSPVVDAVLSMPGVDPRRIAMFGRSFNSALSIRAVAHEPRIAALMVDPGETSRLRSLLSALSAGDDLEAAADELIKQMATASSWLGTTIRMNQHGVDNPLEYLQCLRDYDVATYVAEIRCPVAVGTAEFDASLPQAKEIFEQLKTPKEFQLFRGADAAGDHCELGAGALSQDFYFDWLESVFA